MQYIPTENKIYKQLEDIAHKAMVTVFVGLPGTGKSLYVNQFHAIAKSFKKEIEVIQWDIARKSFETEALAKIFPMKDGQVHAGVKLCAGRWLIAYLQNWHLRTLDYANKILLIEAPLVGNRFSELAHSQDNPELEKFLSSEQVQFVLPIPSREVRKKIEEDRAAQVSESATQWSGAKPSVMRQLWTDTLGIGRRLQLIDSIDGKYDPNNYKKIYTYILRHRNLRVLEVNQIFDVNIKDEKSLHSLKNVIPSTQKIDELAMEIKTQNLTEAEIKEITSHWYNS